MKDTKKFYPYQKLISERMRNAEIITYIEPEVRVVGDKEYIKPVLLEGKIVTHSTKRGNNNDKSS